MKYLLLSIIFIFSLFDSAETGLDAWKFVKEKEGIRIFSKNDEKSPIKWFKGEAYIKTTPKKLTSLIGNIHNHEWWDKSIKEVRIISEGNDNSARFYVVIRVPWPMNNRDVCARMYSKKDSVTGIQYVTTESVTDLVPEQAGLVRIKKYWQQWTIRPVNENLISITLEGYVDPGGEIPAWLYNLVMVDTPWRTIQRVKREVAQK